jgi:putative PIN family toxin of toxin-antitoxin system
MVQRIVVDTNALVSRLLPPRSVPAAAIRKATAAGQLLISEAALAELADVLARPKFAAYVSLHDRQQFIRVLGRIAEMVPITRIIRECRGAQGRQVPGTRCQWSRTRHHYW